MRYQQFQAVSEHPSTLVNPAVYLKVGTVEVKDVHYAISADGFIYIQVSTNYPSWAGMVNQYRTIADCKDGLILVNSDDICADDVYDVYILRDDVDITNDEHAQIKNLVEERSWLASHQNGTAVVHWNLVSSIQKKECAKSVSIRHRPVDCPLCGEPLETDDYSGESYCGNRHCKVHKYSEICRYINVACKLPQYQLLCKRFIDAKLISSIPDLYTKLLDYLLGIDQPMALSELDESKRATRWKKFGTTSEIQAFIDDLQATIGSLKFGDWLQSLATAPDFKYILIEDSTNLVNRKIAKGKISDYLCPTVLNDHFQEHPDHFPVWLSDLSQAYFESNYFDDPESEESDHPDLLLWKQLYGSEIESMMSLPVFFYFENLREELTAAIFSLITLGIFAPGGHLGPGNRIIQMDGATPQLQQTARHLETINNY